MKKLLFISNSTKPSIEEQMSREKVKLSNVSIPCIEAAQSMGYKVYMGINRINAEELECDYEVKFYNACIYRSIFDFNSNFIAFRNLMAIIKKEQFDVIHCNTPIGGVLGRLCGRLTNVSKIIYTAHGFHFYNGAPLINRTIFKWAEAIMAHFTDVIITMNDEDYKAAQKFKLRKGGKVYYVPGVGIDTKIYQRIVVDREGVRQNLGLHVNDIVLIAMGDLIERKNYAASIKAIAQADNPCLKLLICGMGPELVKLQKLAKELGVEKNIYFLGFRSDIKELLAIADIFLLTSYQEGLPRSLMEAMASGLPCIASKIRGNIDLLADGKGGYLLEADDIVGFGEAIRKVASNESLRTSMGIWNQEIIKKFDIGNVKLRIKEIYGELL